MFLWTELELISVCNKYIPELKVAGNITCPLLVFPEKTSKPVELKRRTRTSELNPEKLIRSEHGLG
jgi:hypothetical protein